ncbi:hypothetical protein SDC9_126023 [bioreactor metagenome]|uniref:Uncharacterized protein n=1 Tax=bioreactor metagenome TaxID=1076179 RepID=A0A645CQ12_9ZZZZ
MTGVQVQIAVTALYIAPEHTLHHCHPDKGGGTGSDLRLIETGSGNLSIDLFSAFHLEKFIFNRSVTVQTLLKPFHTVEQQIGFKSMACTGRRYRPGRGGPAGNTFDPL